MTTIFDKILNGEIPCDEVFSDNKCLAFKDITPQAPTHILIIPRKPIQSLKQIQEEDKELLGHLLLKGTAIATAAGLESWRTVINTGEEAGQTVFHLHIHIIGGRKLSWPPG
jgi:histidine triad (HIT) family protein